MKTMLIAGGSGLVGRKLQIEFKNKGYQVRVLSRNPKKENEYRWNPDKLEIDILAFDNVHVLINLCGESIAEKRWSATRKKQLFDSRIKTTEFLANYIDLMPKLECYISASGINSYGFENNTKNYVETDAFGSDYLSQLIKEWESAADLFSSHCRVVKMRTAVVLDKDGGALKKMGQTIRLGIGSALGTGNQIMPWVHISDLASAFRHVVEHSIEGPVNIVGGNDTNQDFMKIFANTLNKPFWFPKVPSFVLKLVVGEMSIILLKGIKASNQKLVDSDFRFEFPDLKKAMDDLF